MATKTQVVLVDDLTGDPADTTVTFALDKTEYEIDLTEDNEVFSPATRTRLTGAVRVAGQDGSGSSGASSPAPRGGLPPGAIRQPRWHRGLACSDAFSGRSRTG